MLLVLQAMAFAQQGSYTVIRTAGTLPSSCVVGGFIQKTGSSAGMYFCSAPNTWSGPLLLTASSGTVTSVTFTGDGTVLSSTPSSAVTTSGTLTAAIANAGAGTILGNTTSSSASPTYSATPVLGVDNTTAGTLTTANGSAAAHTIWGSAATTTNTIKGFTVVPTTGHMVTCTSSGTTCTLTDGGAAATGTVTSVATTSPITGGTITGTGTIACATCVVASSPGAGVAHFAGSTQTVTSSAIVGSDMTNNTVTSTQMAVVNNRRVCALPVGDGTNTVVSGDYSPFKVGRCIIPYAATIVEVFAQSDAGTPSFQLQRRVGASTVTDILSGALATAGTTKVCAKTGTSATCIDGTTSSGSITISTTSLSAGDILEMKSGTASTEKRTDVFVVYTVN